MKSVDAALASVSGTRSVADRLDVLRALVEYWHGPIERGDGLDEGDLQGFALPLPLKWWYRLAGRRSGLVDGTNRLSQPDQLETVEGGRVLFFVENQGVYVWSTQETGEDPPVWGKFNEDSLPWLLEGMSLSEFLIQSCLFEAIIDSAFGASCSWADEPTLERILRPLSPLPVAPWHWPEYPSRFHFGNGVFVFSCPNGEADGRCGYSVFAGAKSREPLAYLREVVDDRWEHINL